MSYDDFLRKTRPLRLDEVKIEDKEVVFRLYLTKDRPLVEPVPLRVEVIGYRTERGYEPVGKEERNLVEEEIDKKIEEYEIKSEIETISFIDIFTSLKDWNEPGIYEKDKTARMLMKKMKETSGDKR